MTFQGQIQKPRFTIPAEPRAAEERLSNYKILIHGTSGIGKTTLLASVPNVLILDTERGTLARGGYIAEITSWPQFVEAVEIIEKGGASRFKTIAIDTLDSLYNLLWDWALPKMGVGYPSEVTQGSGWDKLTGTFMKELNRLKLFPMGLICTAHTMITTVKVKGTGAEYSLFQPAFVGSSARSTYKRVIDAFDLIGFMRTERMETVPKKAHDSRTSPDMRVLGVTEKDVRILDFTPSNEWEAKDRSGLLGKIILPDDWREDWNTIEEVWKRKQNPGLEAPE